jgi:cysteine desulfurase
MLRALVLSPEEASEGLRISLGWTTTEADVARLREVLPGIVERVRAAVSLSAAAPSHAGGAGISLRGAS